MRSRFLTYLLLAFLMVLVLFWLNLLMGSVEVPCTYVIRSLAGHGGTESFTVLQLRLPQTVTALFCGASTAVSGLLLQTTFRNPLADPSVFGITGGASLGVAMVMLFLGGTVALGTLAWGSRLAIVGAAFMGAMLVTLFVSAVSAIVRHDMMLVVVSIMVGYAVSSLVSMLCYLASAQSVQTYMVWGMGDFGQVPLSALPLLILLLLPALLLALLLAKPLDTLLYGDEVAYNLGTNIRQMRTGLLLLAGWMTAVCTAFCGPLAFIGLAVPHIARLLLSTDSHRHLLPLTLLLGSALALLCLLLSRLSPVGIQMPVNVLTSMFGSPIIIYILLRK